MALPALHAVRGRFPNTEISVLALPYVADIYREQGVADEFIAYDRNRPARWDYVAKRKWRRS